MIRGKGIVAGVLFPLVLIATAYALLFSHPGASGVLVRAQFADAGLLSPGDYVEVGGTKVGTVQSLTLTDQGTALATLSIARGIPIHADAAASVRASDLLGDEYLSLSPGTSSAPLRGPIPATRTFVATDLQDLLNTFNEPTRTALQTLIVELGTALDARGADLNEAVLQLAPAVGELQRVAGQVGTQNASLEQLVVKAHGLTSQLAPHTQDISRLITGLDNTLQITAARTPALNLGLHQLPETLAQTQTTLGQLTDAATAATPVASQLEAAAPALDDAVSMITPFAGEVRPALKELSPMLALAGKALSTGAQPLGLLHAAVDTLQTVAPPVVKLLNILHPVIKIGIEGFTDGLGALAAEPGPGARNYFRGELALGCEMFGIPTHPGCLTEALQDELAGLLPATASGRTGAKRPAHGTTTTAAPTVAPTVKSTTPPPPVSLPANPVRQIVKSVGTVLGGLTGASGASQGSPSSTLGNLLKYLTGP